MLVEPGFFRTELLTPESTNYAASSIEDYAERTEQTITAWKAMDGQQGGDPAKLADALVHLAGQQEPPLRFAAGADAVTHVRAICPQLLERALVVALAPEGVGKLPYGRLSVDGLAGWGALVARARQQNPPEPGPKPNTRPGSTWATWPSSASS